MRLIILFSLILSVLAVSSDRVFLSSADELKANLLVYDNPIDDFAVSVRQPLNIPIADNDGPNRPGWVYLDLI